MQHRLGPVPPAARSFIEELPDVTVTERHGNVTCAVCCEALPKGSDARQLPCKHLFHDLCILKWLAMHSSCPLCRHELPTLDADYEDRKREAQERAGRAPKRDTGMMYM